MVGLSESQRHPGFAGIDWMGFGGEVQWGRNMKRMSLHGLMNRLN